MLWLIIYTKLASNFTLICHSALWNRQKSTQKLITTSIVSMRIENIRKETLAERVRIAGTVIWENRDRPSQDIYYEIPVEFGEDLVCNPHTFLTVCTLPAMRYGESRIALDAPICPELRDGLMFVMNCLVNWYGGERRVIPIEAPLQTQPSPPAQPPRAGCFFSGGIDALTTLCTNRLNFPLEHPLAIKDGILVYGILQGEDDQDPSFQNVINAVTLMAKDAGINLITVYTNAYAHIRDLDADFRFWRYEFHGSCLASVAHALASRFNTVSIGSTYDLAHLVPWGSHPMTDPHFSSSDLRIRHEDAALSRLEKTQIVAEWDVALKHLRVCNEKDSYREGNYNCGKCEKCVRTMTTLLTLNALEKTDTFKEKDVSAERIINSAYLGSSYQEACYRDLIAPLAQMGRYDLVQAIQKVIVRYHERDLKGIIKRLNRILFKGSLFNLGKKIKAAS